MTRNPRDDIYEHVGRTSMTGSQSCRTAKEVQGLESKGKKRNFVLHIAPESHRHAETRLGLCTLQQRGCRLAAWCGSVNTCGGAVAVK